MQDDEPLAVTLDEPGLAACYAAAAQGVCITGDRAGQPTLRLVVPHHTPAANRAARAAADAAANKPAAEVRGVNVYAQQVVDGRDRPQIERLCRYITRPPVAQGSLELRADGRIELSRPHARADQVRHDRTPPLLSHIRDFQVLLCAARHRAGPPRETRLVGGAHDRGVAETLTEKPNSSSGTPGSEGSSSCSRRRGAARGHECPSRSHGSTAARSRQCP